MTKTLEQVLTLFARREPTQDGDTIHMMQTSNQWTREKTWRRAGEMYKDVVLYRDKECNGKSVAIHPWHYSNIPTRRNKSVMHNCARYKLVWVADVPKHLTPYFVMPRFNNPHVVAVLREGRLAGLHTSYDQTKGNTVLATGHGDAVLKWLELNGKKSSITAVHQLAKLDNESFEFDWASG